MKNTKTILVSGCPRSGTSWVHFLLATHIDTLTCRETHVYDKYIKPLKNWFDHEHSLKGADGLSSIFNEEEFIKEILAPIVYTTFSRIGAVENHNQVVLEKTPSNILHHWLISRIQPKASVLFVVRDPRAVYASFKAAGGENWGSWAKKTPEQFCESWNKYITAYLAAKSYLPEEHLMRVRYEDMATDGNKWLTKICNWARLPLSDGFIERALEENKIENLQNASRETIQYDRRRNFYRHGKAYGWVDELKLEEIRRIESNCMDLMMIMGYPKHTPCVT